MGNKRSNTGTPEGATHTQQVDGLQNTGFSGAVSPVEYVDLLKLSQTHLTKIADLLNLKVF